MSRTKGHGRHETVEQHIEEDGGSQDELDDDEEDELDEEEEEEQWRRGFLHPSTAFSSLT